MPLTKGNLESIERLVRLIVIEELDGITKGLKVSLSALDSRLAGIERKLDASIAGVESYVESLRDTLSG